MPPQSRRLARFYVPFGIDPRYTSNETFPPISASDEINRGIPNANPAIRFGRGISSPTSPRVRVHILDQGKRSGAVELHAYRCRAHRST
jgi:hypothetical protein